MFLLILWIQSAIWFSPNPIANDTSNLTINVKDIKQKKGWIRVALYKDNKLFLKDKGQFLGKSVPVSDLNMTVNIESLPYGKYAIAVYHDTNSNFKFDTNFLGIPTESYGFGKVPVTKWRAPKFNEVGIKINAPNKAVNIAIKKWTEY